MRLRIVTLQLEIIEAERKQVLYLGIDLHSRQRARFALQLGSGLLQVIGIEMGIAQGMDELTRLQITDLSPVNRP